MGSLTPVQPPPTGEEAVLHRGGVDTAGAPVFRVYGNGRTQVQPFGADSVMPRAQGDRRAYGESCEHEFLPPESGPALADRIRADPHLLDQVWEEAEVTDPELLVIDRERDTLFENFLGISGQVYEDAGAYPWMLKAMEGTGTQIDYEFGYGNGYVITPQEAAEIADGLLQEGWSETPELEASVSGAIVDFYRSAGDQGQFILGGVA